MTSSSFLAGEAPLRFVDTDTLRIGYHVVGSEEGWPVVLSHGFPYDVLAYEEVADQLAVQGACVLLPFLRGFGPTTFRRADTIRSGQQAALGQDLLNFLDATDIDRATLAGFDWGGRASCIVSALHPSRVSSLVSAGSYNIQDIARSAEPSPDPREEASYWYMWYFGTERGQRGLARHRDALTRHLWTLWSPTWDHNDATFRRTARSFDNPDFVEVVIHSYRHRFGHADGDPALAAGEAALASQPDIAVPTITLDGAVDGVDFGSDGHPTKFSNGHRHHVLPDIGHNVPQESPLAFVDAVLESRHLALRQ